MGDEFFPSRFSPALPAVPQMGPRLVRNSGQQESRNEWVFGIDHVDNEAPEQERTLKTEQMDRPSASPRRQGKRPAALRHYETAREAIAPRRRAIPAANCTYVLAEQRSHSLVSKPIPFPPRMNTVI
jgi:hypothetical protein